jgi:3-oxoacyl-[acyl-carrier-protein] synthase-3
LQAANQLLNDKNIQREEIDVLIFVSQSRDYFLPSTSIILQQKLGLSSNCIAFDIGLGCSGYVYGLASITSLMSTAKLRKGLLLTGDVSSVSLNKKDKSTYPLFGDAGTATLLEFNTGDKMDFNLQSDGKGSDAIIITDGGLRKPLTEESYIEREIDKGIIRAGKNLSLDGLEVFNFSLREVSPNIQALLNYNHSSISDYHYLVFHQANKLMNETIRKKLKATPEQVPYSLKNYGNTSSASIPLTIVTELADAVKSGEQKFIFSGFGVGLSWGSVALKTNDLYCPPITEI